MAAYGTGSRRVTLAHMRRAVRDTEGMQGNHRPRLVALVSTLAGLLALGSAGLLYAFSL